MKRIGVGVIGASPLNPGWALAAHIPAIRALPEQFELRAVSTSNARSARAAADALQVAAFDNGAELIARPDVELVVVAVRVPQHYPLVAAAIGAGKMVLSEWPLGVTRQESEQLAEQARTAAVRTAVCLQGRFSPALRQARKLVREGYVGQVLSTTLVGTGIAWGPSTDSSHAYLYDANNGATALTVAAMHAIDAMECTLGEFASVAAHLMSPFESVRILNTNEVMNVTVPTHVTVVGELTSGAAATVVYRGGTSRGTNLLWEINGTEGDLALTANIGNVQVADPVLRGGRGTDDALAIISSSEDSLRVPEVPGGNIYRLYAQLARDIREGTRIVPDFAHAMRQHRLISTIEAAAAIGTKEVFSDPETTGR
jgi:predicted dehydrogenase